MTKSLDMSPVQKGFIASDPDIIPGQSVYNNGLKKIEKELS
jgi:hypothetical protein